MPIKSVLIALTAFIILLMPAMPANAAPPAKAFGELPVAYDGAISPDGKRIAIIININGQYAIFTKLISGNDDNPWIVSLGEEAKPRYIKWVNNTRYVVSLRKSEKYRGTPFTMRFLYSGDVIEREGRLLIASKKIFRQINDSVVSWLDDDPDHILMEFSPEQWDPYPNIVKVNVNTRRTKVIKRGQTGIEHWTADRYGTPRIGTGQLDNGDKRRVIFNTETEKWDKIDLYPGLDAETPIHGILKDGRELVIGDYQGKDTLGLYVYDLGLKKITRSLYHNDDYDTSGVILSKDGVSVIGAKFTADRDKVELLGEYGTLLDRLRVKFPEYDVSFVDQTEDGDTVLVELSSPVDPGGLYMYRADNANPSLISNMYNNISAADVGGSAAVSYKSRDGQDIPAFVTLPPGQTSPKNLPFIILPHGGPYARDANHFDYFAQFFATRGYGVLQMNFRGSDGYGKKFADAGRNNWVVMQEDVEDGARWLMDKGYADKNRTCIAGWSYGGYAALMGVSTDPDLYKCAIAMAALTDIAGAKRNMREYRGGRHAAKEFFGEAMDDKAVRNANSPIHVAGNIKVPVFLAHGTLDENVQFDQFRSMKKAMQKAKVDATYMEFKDEDHFLSTQKNREDFFIGIEKFLNKVNGPSEYMQK